MQASQHLRSFRDARVSEIRHNILSAGSRASNALRNHLVDGHILNGPRHGIQYKRGSGVHTASSPNESPATDSGEFRLSWDPRTVVPRYGATYSVTAGVESDLKVGGKGLLLGDLLENGTSRMAPRKYKDKAVDAAMPEIESIYRNL